MGLEGKVILQRIESDGTVKTLDLNSSNQPNFNNLFINNKI